MNKEEIEKDDNYWKGYIKKQKEAVEICKICKYRKRCKELEQKETILNKVTDKLKEDIEKYNKELMKDNIMSIKNTDLTARILQSQKILNIIEGEKK